MRLNILKSSSNDRVFFKNSSANVMISLRSANARVFFKNSRHCDYSICR